MSISSMAEESALRLGPIDSRPSVGAMAATAAATAASEVVKNKAAPEAAAKLGEEAAAAAQATQQGGTPAASPLSQLVKYIPTETIALYVAAQGALGELSAPKGGDISDADFGGRWVWLWLMLVATILLTLGLSYRSQKTANPDAKFRPEPNGKKVKVPVFEVLAASVAFLIWAFSLPSTPLRDFAGYDYAAWNSVVLLGGTIAVAAAAYVFGKTVAWTKVVDV